MRNATLSLIQAFGLAAGMISPSARTERAWMHPTVPACSVAMAASRAVRYADGRTPYVFVTAGVQSGKVVGLVGPLNYTLPANAKRETPPIRALSRIGLIVDERGTVRPFPSPLPRRTIVYPQLLARPDGGWEALFVETTREWPQDIEHSDTLVLWYGRFDGRRWRDTVRVATLTGSKLAPEMTSKLLRDGRGDLAFAFALGDSIGKTGALLVRRMKQRWRLDTLRTPMLVDYVRLAHGPLPGTWVALLRMSFFDRDHRLFAGSIFVATIDTGWHKPVLAVRAPGAGLNEPVLHRLGRKYVTAWWEEQDTSATAPRLVTRWTVLDTLRPAASTDFAPLFDDAGEFTTINLNDSSVVMLSRTLQDSSQLRMVVLGSRGVVGRARVTLPTFVAMAPVRHDGDLWAITALVATRPHEPSLVTLITPIRVRC